jgi:metal-responsive CopG/Arc/MetJ family transcriptional regulator
MYHIHMAQKTSIVNISFRDDLLREIDDVAQSESRSRSELVREAARLYIERKKRMKAALESMRTVASARGLTGDDVEAEIAAYRAEKNAGR